mmetsp:Transcript_75916/g.176058  ORF Transcript_75916/g.176058 Transcript_75916/m.176058 type:complete len:297 (+) Transcript_75916:134-1024(+)
MPMTPQSDELLHSVIAEASGCAERLASLGPLPLKVDPWLNAHTLLAGGGEDLQEPLVGHLSRHLGKGGPIPDLVLEIDIVVGHWSSGIRCEEHDARHLARLVLTLGSSMDNPIPYLHSIPSTEILAGWHHMIVEFRHWQGQRCPSIDKVAHVCCCGMLGVNTDPIKHLLDGWLSSRRVIHQCGSRCSQRHYHLNLAKLQIKMRHLHVAGPDQGNNVLRSPPSVGKGHVRKLLLHDSQTFQHVSTATVVPRKVLEGVSLHTGQEDFMATTSDFHGDIRTHVQHGESMNDACGCPRKT